MRFSSRVYVCLLQIRKATRRPRENASFQKEMYKTTGVSYASELIHYLQFVEMRIRRGREKGREKGKEREREKQDKTLFQNVDGMRFWHTLGG